ncbi:anti-sigma factor [Bacillus lacus]|uniref:Anti-sigma-W factor RsiW n=1 Tax=Metabacillus lacus TaxID=1983721 RepID=A0A7X2IYJ1_9BACI|nr:anti-sigma factor [Metabacillus lacus]MRX72151.1 anti-sigma factor [Metabacillus lacus]
MKCSEEIVRYMHQYLDHDIEEEDEVVLRHHLKTCTACSQHFHDLEKAVALVQSTSHIEAPADFTASIMKALPQEKKSVTANRWFRNHPFLVAASLFLLFMTGSVLSAWNGEQDFSVSKQNNLIVENGIVTVPEGEIVRGDVTVKNGSINIEGTVEGDVTIVNGEKYMASAGHVTGEITEVNQVFDWLWLKMKELGNDVIDIFE